MECFDVHVALEACDIVIESATIVAILESASGTLTRPHLRNFSAETADATESNPGAATNEQAINANSIQRKDAEAQRISTSDVRRWTWIDASTGALTKINEDRTPRMN
jgi:hypothetical protein